MTERLWVSLHTGDPEGPGGMQEWRAPGYERRELCAYERDGTGVQFREDVTWRPQRKDCFVTHCGISLEPTIGAPLLMSAPIWPPIFFDSAYAVTPRLGAASRIPASPVHGAR